MSSYSGSYYVVSGVSFAVLLVGSGAVSSQRSRDETTAFFQPFFPQIPIVFAIQDQNRRLTFWGEKRLTDYLVKAGPVQWSNWSFK
jgi:hypothetical protein